MTRLVMGAALLVVACSSSSVPTTRQRCSLYEGLSKGVPAGGVAISIDVPAAWQRRDYGDGTCEFTRGGGDRLSVKLEFCPIGPCDTELAGKRTSETGDVTVLKQTLRTTKVRIGDPVSHFVVACAGSVQGTTISPEMDAQLRQLVAPCDTLTIASAPPSR